MNKTLIIPDLHSRSFWKDAVLKYINEADKIVFLGDYVDPYPQENITRKEAIKTLEDVIDFKTKFNDKTILLLGNHCVHYFLKDYPRSTRYDSSNAYHIRELYLSHKGLFKLAYETTINDKKYLFTHAGLMNSWVERNKDVIGKPTTDNLNKLMDTPQGIKALGEMSFYRSWLGEDSGSILWSDVREKISEESNENAIMPKEDSINPLYDYQIFGHTQLSQNPIITDKWACIDCRKAFILDENGKLNEV